MLRGAARRHDRFRRRLGPFGARGVPRLARRETSLRPGPGHVLVPGDARRPQRQARRRERGEGAQHRRGALGRDGAAAAADRSRHRPCARRRADRAGAGCGGGPASLRALPAARALEERKIDGFWANGMGTEVAVRRGVGTVVLDVRRGDGPKAAFDFTFSSIAATDSLIARAPDAAAAAVRAIVKTQRALKHDVALATRVGEKLFPPEQAALIAELIRRDLPYYDAAISPRTVAAT